MGSDFGDEIQAWLWSDASAAIAISQRSGLCKLRHIQTQHLWLQERVSAKELQLTKVVGIANPADMFTTHLAKPDLDKHLEFSGLIISAGRADGSLQGGALGGGGVRPLRPVARCKSVVTCVSAALRLAVGSFMMYGTSKFGLPPSAVGGYKFSRASAPSR